jgi:predicted DsbA family dithiol-disulfide isomerase
MREKIRFHFDPACPWCYLTARWVERLEALGAVEADWGVFSLALANGDGRGPSEQALRTAVHVRHGHGQQACGRFYLALGARVHERGAAVDDPAVIAAALDDIALEPALCEKAQADEGTWNEVIAEHERLVERTRSFGVPTIVLDGGEGPAIFGPVISEVPSDEDAVELYRHVAWLTRHQAFSELKRDRSIDPDLESFRRWKAAQDPG